jgi:HK97 family phage prohead protease
MPELKQEFRSAELVDASLSGRTVHGYAAVFDTPWNERLVERNGYVETIARGAFRKGLSAGGNIPLLWQHERRDMLATTGGGTLRLKEDARGLAFEADLPTNPLGEYVREMVERGDVRGMSYGMASIPDQDSTITRNQDGRYQRTINNVRQLLDVTLTYDPSYEEATVELRSMGFAALPLQEIVGGLEAQPDEAATAKASIAMAAYRKRTDAVRLTILEG